MLQKIDVSKARENLSQIMEKAYFAGEKFVLLRRGIPMVLIVGMKELDKTMQPSLVIKKSGVGKLFGIWKNKRGSSIKIANYLRKKAWETHVS